MNTLTQCDELNAAAKAMKRYRRLKTILNKAVETADICGLHFNVLIYDPKHHKFRENYTADLIKLECLKDLAQKQPDNTMHPNMYRALKF